MNISAANAIKHFFYSSSFDMIYVEAVANAFDAGATDIDISISLKSFAKVETLALTIRDNGEGFNDDNFNRFSNLLDPRDSQHKGLGRLIYLKYFKSIIVESAFGKTNKRTFCLNDSIENLCNERIEPAKSFSQLKFINFKEQRLNSYDDVVPWKIKSLLLDTFASTFYAFKDRNKSFKITITLKDVEEENENKSFTNSSVELDATDLHEFKLKEFEVPELDFFDKNCKILYYIDTDSSQEVFRTYLIVDGRSIPFTLISNTFLPRGVSATFLFSSKFLDSKSNDSRQAVSLSEEDKKIISNNYIDKIIEIFDENVPQIKDENKAIKSSLETNFPHLIGYFGTKNIGLINKNKVLLEAQEAFLNEEKMVLEAQNLSDEQYIKSLNFASRALAHYIIYRNKIIRKLKLSVFNESAEKEIHNIIVPMKKTFNNSNISTSLYRNNAWLLDDKYMSYQYVLSDKKMDELLSKIRCENEIKSNLRPDIALVFSDDIDKTDHKVDVVIVELKRKGIDYLENSAVIDQIRQRARLLATFYPNKIQRIWFFGVISFDDDMLKKMKEEKWIPIYSNGHAFYNELSIYPYEDKQDQAVCLPITLISYEAICNDAENRNATFLNILRDTINSDKS